MSQKPNDSSASELLRLLQAPFSGLLLPELAAASPAALAATPLGAELLAWGREVKAEPAIPETTYTRYRQFKRTGERPPYERPYFDKRALLTREIVAAWLAQDFSRVDRINDLIWSICEETTWVAPAHEKGLANIDLFAAETGVDLAHALMLLGDRLPAEIRERVRTEVHARIFEPYLAQGNLYWWTAGANNWTGVCAGSVGQTFLMLEPDPERQAQGLTLVLDQLDRFIRHAFEDDGGCLEGIGYWNYGLIHYVGFAEMLRERSGGKIDLLAQDKIKAIARYPLNVLLAKDTYASFADAHEHSSVRPFLAARLGDRAGAPGLRGLIGGATDWRLTSVLRNLLWGDGKRAETPDLEDVFLTQSGIARLVGRAGQKPLALAIKAGHNAEPHNHNDVGSFVLCIDGLVYLCDPGAGLYNAAYFGAKRYDNVFANSYGHSVPRIGGTLQLAGREHCGTLEQAGPKSVHIRFEKAYDVAGLREAARDVSVQDDAVTLRDTFQFDAAGPDVEEAFVTWQKVEVNGNVARVSTDRGTLEIKTDAGTFAAERLEEACKANHKSDILTRIAVTYPAGARVETGFAMVFRPAS